MILLLNLILTVILGYQIFLPVGREEETVAYSYLDIIPSTTYQLCSWFKSFNSQGSFLNCFWSLIGGKSLLMADQLKTFQGQIIRLSVDDEDSKYFSISINGNKLQIETEKDETEPIISGLFSKSLSDWLTYFWPMNALNASTNKDQFENSLSRC